MLTIRHLQGGRTRRLEPAELAGARDAEGTVWIDLSAPTPEEAAILSHDRIDLDPLTIEDMREDRHLPKLEELGDCLSLTVHGLALETAAVELGTHELDIALKEGLLVTYHEEDLPAVEAVGRRLDATERHRIDTPVQLLHLVLDTMTGIFVPFLDHLDRRIDVIEADILSEPTETTRRDIYELQRDVIQLRRAVVPQAEVIRQLSHDPSGLVDEPDLALFRDLYDHLYRMAEMSDSYLQLLDSALQSYRSSQDDDLNEMLRVLTLVSATLLPISVIAGIYGTNFDVIPELDWRWGYYAMWGLFALIILGMVTWFRHRGWIGRRAEQEAQDRRTALSSVLQVPVLGKVLDVPVTGARTVARSGIRTARHGVRTARRGVDTAREGLGGWGRRADRTGDSEDPER